MTVQPAIVSLPVARVHPNPHNQRAGLGDVGELAESIRQVGLLQPVIVRSDPDRTGEWLLVAGHRRHAAYMTLKLKSIPAIVRDDLAVPESLAAMLVENLQRVDLSPLEEAAGYRQLVELGWRQKDIAAKTGRSPAVVSKRIRLLDLPDEILPAVRDGRLSVETAYELSRAFNERDVDRAELSVRVMDLLGDPTYDLKDRADMAVVDEEIAYVAEQALSRVARDREETAARADLTAAGQTELAGEGRAAGALPVEGWWGLDVEYDRHRTEPCSRFRLIWRGSPAHPVAEYWCDSPARHYPAGESELKVSDDWWRTHDLDRNPDPDGRESSYTARQKKIDAARLRRLDLYRTLMATPPKRWPVTAELVYQQAFVLALNQEWYFNGSDIELACDLLDIPRKSSDTVTVLRGLQEAFAGDPQRTALAVVLAAGEGWRLNNDEYEDKHGPQRQFLTLLGHHPHTSDGQPSFDTGDAA